MFNPRQVCRYLLFIFITISWGSAFAENESVLLENAHMDDLDAQMELANLYLDSLETGSPVNRLKVFRWISHQANADDVNAQITLAEMYLYGVGTEPDDEAMLAWMRTAAEAGSAKAQLYMSNLYRGGEVGLERSLPTAIAWAEKAANQGDPRAQRQLGRLFDSPNVSGPSVRDLEKSKQWNIAGYETFKQLAESGDADAQYAVADIYFYGIEGWMQEIDRVESFRWFFEAANQGHPAAQYAVASAYQQGGIDKPLGHGVEQSTEKAIEWYTRAAEQGVEEAINVLENTYSISLP